MGDKYSIEVNTKTGSMFISKNAIRKSGVTNTIMKIPLIRGLYMFFYVIFFLISDSLRDLFKKPVRAAIFIMFFGGLLIFMRYVSPAEHPVVAKGVQTIMWTVMGLVYALLFLFLYTARTNHSIEHKVIGAYDKTKSLNLRTIKKQPKEHPRCGGVLVAWFFILYGIYFMVMGNAPSSIIITWILFSIGYELARLAGREGIVGKIFFTPGYYLQKLTTSKKIPLDRLKRGQNALRTLLHKEKQKVNMR
jgi:uncharacterized protein YqhQ